MMDEHAPRHPDFALESEGETFSQSAEQTRRPPRASLHATVQRALNAALWQNSVPVLSELALTNLSSDPLSELTIELTSEPPVLRPGRGVCSSSVRAKFM
jgi:hypothetical protein